MTDKLKKTALALAGLKAGQQILNDLDRIVLDDSTSDMVRFGAEQGCRIGTAIVGAYAIDKAISYAEEFLPKATRGLLSITAATIGAGAAVHYFGEYMNTESSGIARNTLDLLNNYKDSIVNFATFNPNVDGGYLTGALICAKGTMRLLKNITVTTLESLEDYVETKKIRNRAKEHEKKLRKKEKRIRASESYAA